MKKIKLTQGKFALLDDEDFDEINKHSWHCAKIKNTFYARATINGRTAFMHRLIMKAKRAQQCDHINMNGLDNQKINLRLCNNSENNQNKEKHIDNKSGFKGVAWNKKRKKWVVFIGFNYKHINLGGFHNIIDAAKAYNKAAKKYHKEFARLNKL